MSIYKCENLALMPYLQMNGLEYTGKEVSIIENRAQVVAVFNDPRDIGSELAMAWNNSSEKQYRDWWTFFRNEINKALSGLVKGGS